MNDKLDEVLKEIHNLRKELKEELKSFRAEVRRGFDGVGEGFKTTGEMIDSLPNGWENKKGFFREED